MHLRWKSLFAHFKEYHENHKLRYHIFYSEFSLRVSCSLPVLNFYLKQKCSVIWLIIFDFPLLLLNEGMSFSFTANSPCSSCTFESSSSKKCISQLNVIYKWTQCCHLAPECGFCAAELFFLCACHYFANINFKTYFAIKLLLLLSSRCKSVLFLCLPSEI